MQPKLNQIEKKKKKIETKSGHHHLLEWSHLHCKCMGMEELDSRLQT